MPKLKRTRKRKPKLIKAVSKRKKKPKLVKAKIRKKKVLARKGKIIPKIGRSFLLKKIALKFSALALIILLNWSGLSAIGKTAAYLQDTETSNNNNFTAGTLDFELAVPFDFPASAIEIGGFATKTIDLINLGNTPKYKVRADNFEGDLCSYLNLEANLDGNLEYTGSLMAFTEWGPTIFTDPDTWNFTLTLSPTTPQNLIGETCNFKFIFWGSQIRNDLPFGQGFNDTEEENNNVKAKVCYGGEFRSKGFWKSSNHYDIYKPYLPQYLGCNTTSSQCVAGYEMVNTQAKVFQILQTDYSSSMRNKLREQLLAMKFNIAHFKIGEYIPTSSNYTLNQIVVQADALLQQNPAPSDDILETAKNYLDNLNSAENLQFRVCSGSFVRVIVPNGGEVYWVGHYVDLIWETHNLNCSTDSLASIWYSKDSGATWGNIATSTENDGIYTWRIPLYLENNTYYVPSGNARIKVVTRCSETLLTNGWDMSDNDFCPPIDFSLLTPEELEQAKALGLLPEDFVVGSESSEIILQELSSTTEETIDVPTEETTTEEIISSGSGETAIPANDGTTTVIEQTTTEEIIEGGTTTEEQVIEGLPVEETPIEEPATQEVPAGEELSPMNQLPATEQEVIMTPQDIPIIQSDNPPDGGGDSGSNPPTDGGNEDSGTATTE